MRISDWSSDVCSSDLLPLRAAVEGETRWWAISGRPQVDTGGRFAGYRGSGADITAQRQSAEDASRLALYDSLTGLANRFHISKKLDTTLAAFTQQDRKSTRLNSSHSCASRMPSPA